jgi:hypothetical protein
MELALFSDATMVKGKFAPVPKHHVTLTSTVSEKAPRTVCIAPDAGVCNIDPGPKHDMKCCGSTFIAHRRLLSDIDRNNMCHIASVINLVNRQSLGHHHVWYISL